MLIPSAEIPQFIAGLWMCSVGRALGHGLSTRSPLQQCPKQLLSECDSDRAPVAAARLFSPGTWHKALAAAFPVCNKLGSSKRERDLQNGLVWGDFRDHLPSTGLCCSKPIPAWPSLPPLTWIRDGGPLAVYQNKYFVSFKFIWTWFFYTTKF